MSETSANVLTSSNPMMASALLDAVIIWLDDHGGSSIDTTGFATQPLRREIGDNIGSQIPNAEAAGLLTRRVSGKRTFEVHLTPKGRAWATVARAARDHQAGPVPGRTGLMFLAALTHGRQSNDERVIKAVGESSENMRVRRTQLEQAGWIDVESNNPASSRGRRIRGFRLSPWAVLVAEALADLEPAIAKRAGFKRGAPSLALVNQPAVELVSPNHPSVVSDPEPDDGVPARPEPVPAVVEAGDMATAIEMMGDALAMLARGFAAQMRQPAAASIPLAPHGDVARQLGEANARIEVLRNQLAKADERNRDLTDQVNRASRQLRSGSQSTVQRPAVPAAPTTGALDLRALGVKDARMRTLYRHAADHGWRIENTNGGHHRLIPPDPTAEIIHTSKTPSDHRVYDNLHMQLVRAGLPKLGEVSVPT